MARYGREYLRRSRGGGRGGVREPAYGWEYEPERRYGGRRERFDIGYGEEPGYTEELGYGAETGYGAEMEYGEEALEYPYGYDYEFGGRGWPYREAWLGRRRRGDYEPRGFGGYDWELQRPEDFRAMYGYEYARPGEPRFRRTRGRLPWRPSERRGRYARGEMRRRAELGYEGEFSIGAYGGRPAEPGYDRSWRRREDYDIEMTSRAGMLSGHTPPDRWPDIGHDVDHRPSRERAMGDDEVREAVLENLFQDTWVDPERVDVSVDRGVVTLTGEVRDFMEARYAWDDAWESAGVRGVINNLTVRADRPQEEMDLPQTSGSRKPPPKRRR